MNLIIDLCEWLAIIVMCVVLHEFGHWYTLRTFTKKPIKFYFTKGDIDCGKENDYKGLNKPQLLAIYLAGIILGFLPVFIFLGAGYLQSILIITYMLLCYKDIQAIWRVIKW